MADQTDLEKEVFSLRARVANLEQTNYAIGEQLRMVNAAVAGLLFERHLRITEIIAMETQQDLH